MIDLYSDTLTKPTPGMRRAMAEAPVGDEQKREDPTTNRLQEMVAAMLGKEAAVFLPSGTMCNAIAVKVHTQPSDAILCERSSHVNRSEFGGAAMLSGVTTEPIDGQRGLFSPQQLEQALARFHSYGPVPKLVCVEQTHNFGGGSIWPIDQLRAVCDLAHRRNLLTHMDGARLFNACVAGGIAARDYAACVDSVWIDLSKGLGCPIGAVLAGTRDFIERAWRFKHLFGGAMRQSGILAAAGIYALEYHIQRLREDHENARLLAEGLASIRGIRVENPQPETNIVFFDILQTGLSVAEFQARCESAGVRFSGSGTRLRAVTHLDVSRADIDRAVQIVRSVVGRQQD
ncbi:threonine aldolase family protein [Fontivita pretiosa]|uniref:threonine aldolase family protein n=1 Tax=Fontivita pretiosa TaxID=2989684 RepID=UPI003D185DA2